MFHRQDGTVEDQPVWPMIYFALRCGDAQAACRLAEKAAPSIGPFSGYMKEFTTHGSVSKSTATNIKLMYRKSVRNSTDPFKK